MRWAFVAAVCMMVAMCGQKGPLYLPEEPSAGESSPTADARGSGGGVPRSLAAYFHGKQARVAACSVEPTMHCTLKTYA